MFRFIAALGCLALSVPAPAAKPDNPLTTLLARYDAMKPGAARDELALEIDRVAGQRYATVSRLFWHRDLDAAKREAAVHGKPILHLRMLGRLDEDLSCANSRFFRTTLYANADVSKFLRDNFVLYWSSERPVPRVTIDMGDGRKIERTVTGNSAHYVMDDRGNVLDVLPGLYAPIVFRAELAKSLALAKQTRELDGAKLVDAVVAHHRKEVEATNAQYAKVGGITFTVRRGGLLTSREIGASAIASAQQATYAKAYVEVPELRQIGIDAGTIDRTDAAQWAAVGQLAWKLEAGKVFDAQSVALITRVRAGNPFPQTTSAAVARLEQAVAADTALNQFRLRATIRSYLLGQRNLAWDQLNDFIYASVFHTPKHDPWLGLLEGTDFTGLPADGVRAR